MSITYKSSASLGRAITTLSANYTVHNDSNLLVVQVLGYTTTAPTDITYNGTAMTLAGYLPGTGNYPTRSNYVYYMLDPPTGTHTLSATGTTGQYVYILGADYSGVGGFDAVATADSAGSDVSTLTATITTTRANCWCIMASLSNYDSGQHTGGTGTTERVAGPFNENSLFDSNGALSQGSNSLIVNIATAKKLDAVIVSFYPAVISTQMQINIGDSWKTVAGIKINIGDSWKTVAGIKINIGDSWKTVF
jgi:hypothetical protein